MSSHFPDDLLTRAAGEGIRLIALRRLDEVVEARARLDDPADADALHDFRVALRRLRSCLRSYRSQLESSVGRSLGRRLRRFSRAAGTSRDLEVHIQWLDDQISHLGSVDTAAIGQLLDHLRYRKAEADRRLRRRLKRSFDTTSTRVERRLRDYRRRLSLDDSRRKPVAPAIGRRVTALNERLVRALAAVETAHDVRPAHEARIAAKHLRYALEPVERLLAGTTEIVDELRTLQDSLGELHDGQVLLDELERFAMDGAASDIAILDDTENGLGGLDILTHRVRARVARAFASVQPTWLGGVAAPFSERVSGIATALMQYGLPREIERKFLLRACPPETADAQVLEIEQGWLPGAAIIERLRRVRLDGAEGHYRTIKLGGGLARVEIEEPMAPALFASLWPLTADRRIAKRRYRVPDAGTSLVWEIDDFHERELVLAEIELPSEMTEVEPPDWLAPYIVREVTDEGEFTNYQLAQRVPQPSSGTT
jgi:CHAD domain-containing protein/CYTH domain-containing protein